MDRDEIKNILPHREPMLLIDETELADGAAIARYTVRGDEFFLQGHFPGNPVVPGVILCEMMAQSACLLANGGGESMTPYLTGLKNVKFRNKVAPGDTITFTCRMTAQKGAFCFIEGEGRVGGKLCVSGELSFAVTREG
jgi:3-hydroxyacyl-[acyl-carrier-protein] dehydratase